MKEKHIIVNLFGGPGSGKSTIAAGLFHLLKIKNFNVEMLREFAKEKVLEKNKVAIDFQPYITGSQAYVQECALNEFEVIITDSPTPLGAIYNKEENNIVRHKYEEYLIAHFRKYNNLNYFITRDYEFDPNGRVHDMKEAQECDKKIQTLLTMYEIPFKIINSNDIELIFKDVEFELRNSNGVYDIKNAEINIKYDIVENKYVATAKYKDIEFVSHQETSYEAVQDLEKQVKFGKQRLDIFNGPNPLEYVMKRGCSPDTTPIADFVNVLNKPTTSMDEKFKEHYDIIKANDKVFEKEMDDIREDKRMKKEILLNTPVAVLKNISPLSPTKVEKIKYVEYPKVNHDNVLKETDKQYSTKPKKMFS